LTEDVDGMSIMRTSCDKREFLRSLDLKEGKFAEAGVVGVLNTCISERGVEGDAVEIEEDLVE